MFVTLALGGFPVLLLCGSMIDYGLDALLIFIAALWFIILFYSIVY